MGDIGRIAISMAACLFLVRAGFAQAPIRVRTVDSDCEAARSAARAYLQRLGFRWSKVQEQPNRVGLVANSVRDANGDRIGEDDLARLVVDPPSPVNESKPRLLPAQYAMGFWTTNGPRWVSGSMEFQQMTAGCQIGMALRFPRGVIMFWAFLPVDSDLGWFTSNGELEARYLAGIAGRLTRPASGSARP